MSMRVCVCAELPNTALREMRALQELNHENVIQLLEVFPQASSLVLVFECMACDMAQVGPVALVAVRARRVVVSRSAP